MYCQACKVRPVEVIEKCDDEMQPYSFVAIDTLVKLIPNPGEHVLSRLTPRPWLLTPATMGLMSQVLREYSEKDKVPRVMQGIDKVIDNWEIICGERIDI